MKVNGIVAEYNPFHNGHAYQLQHAKEANDADQGRPEGRVLAAQGRAEYGAKEDQREGRRQAQTDEHDFDDADGVEGQPQRTGADDKDD